MTTTTDPHGWPDAMRPGYPANPGRDGWHWLKHPEDLRPFPSPWNAELGGWPSGALHSPQGIIDLGFTYLAPCLTPAEVAAAVQAEREACATQLDMMRKAHNDALIGQPHTPDTSIAYGNGAAAIRARGPTPALDAALSQARREGMEEERKAWAAMWARYRNPVAFSEAMQKHIAIRSAAAGGEGT